MRKAELRSYYLNKRKTLSADEVISFSCKIFDQFKLNFLLKEGMKIHIFLSIGKFKEIDTRSFIQELFQQNIRVFVPRLKGNEQETVEITPNSQYVTNSLGIDEPIGESSSVIDFDYILVPLVYCDFTGNRIGYGKGFYDKFFKKISPSKKIGLSIFSPNKLISDANDFDVRLDYLVTPTAVLSFGKS